MSIIGIGPGKFKSVACTDDADISEAAYANAPDAPRRMLEGDRPGAVAGGGSTGEVPEGAAASEAEGRYADAVMPPDRDGRPARRTSHRPARATGVAIRYPPLRAASAHALRPAADIRPPPHRRGGRGRGIIGHHPMDTDRNLLFGVLALQGDLIDSSQFAEACAAWANQKERPLAELLEGRGWISAEDRGHIEYFVGRRLRRHDGDACEGLRRSVDERSRGILAGIDDPEVRRTMAGAPTGGRVLLSTVQHRPESRDRYTLTRLHAKGGIGQVWFAADGDLGRHVALKELRPEQAGNDAARSRFLEEARITGQLEHPGIVPVYELARRDDGRPPFYTMRFVRGRTLREAIGDYHRKRGEGRAGPLDLLGLIDAFLNVCDALAYAHSRGVVHRDLKGQNVALGDFGEVMVLDWGLAKVVGRDEASADAPPVVAGHAGGHHAPTVQGQALGTPAYMAPEQAEGRLDRIDARTDVYGLGAILFEVLAGEPPFTGEDTEDVLRRVVHEEPRRPRQLNPSAPAALEAIALKALAKDPSTRYKSADELAREARRWLADEPVHAYPEPWSKRLGRRMRRHKALVFGLAALLALATAASTITAVAVDGARDQAERARARTRQALRAATQALNTTVVSMADEELAHVPGMEELRRELIVRAVRLYEGQLAYVAEDEDFWIRDGHARTLDIAGNIHRLTGDYERAERYYRDALDIYEDSIAGRDPAPEYLELDLADTLNNLGEMYRMSGRIREAEPHYRRALEITGPLHRRDPDDERLLRLEARTLIDLGNVPQLTGRYDEARALHGRAVALLRPLVDGESNFIRSLPRDTFSLIIALYDLGVDLREGGRPDEAGRAFDEAVRRARAHVEDRPDHNDRLYALAGARHEQGTLFADDPSRTAEAEAAFDEAIDLLERLVDEYPQIAHYRRRLARALLDLGTLSARADRAEAAEGDLRRSRGILEALIADQGPLPHDQGALGRALGRLAELHLARGDAGAARSLLDRAIDLQQAALRANPESPRDLEALRRHRAARSIEP